VGAGISSYDGFVTIESSTISRNKGSSTDGKE
jgi:hypothetical protein